MPIGIHHTRVFRRIESRQNARVKELRAAFTQERRTDGGLLAIEGEHLLQEALRSGLEIGTVFIQSGCETVLDRLGIPENIEILSLPPEVFASAVRTESPQGIAALVRPRDFTLEGTLGGGRPLVLVAAGLQDPGNLGTLIRSAEAFGATGCVILPGTVSPVNQKVLRASSGSVFRLPTVIACEEHLFHELKQRRIRSIAAVAADGEPLSQVDFAHPCAVILGNEGGGVAPSILRRVDARVTIPMPGAVESLNAAVAGSILLYEAARARTHR